MRVLLVAEESAGIQALRAVSRSRHEVVAVLTAPPTTGGGATVAGVARTLEVPILPSARVKEPGLAAWMRDERVDLLLNVHSLYVIHPEVVRAPRIGSFNLHPGPLPDYAGLNAPSWAIYHRECGHGVTLHWMEPEIDTGPIAYQELFDLSEDDTALSVSITCARLGLSLVERLLETAARDEGAIPTVAQDLTGRRYYGREVPEGGRLDWRWPARQVVAFVRACDYLPFTSPWGHPRTRLGDREVGIVKASVSGERAAEPPGTVGRTGEGAVAVAAGDECVVIHRLEVDGGYVGAAELLQPGQRLAAAT